jgi:hypothetical protein
MLPSVLTTSKRKFAASVKAIMHSRHANTRRNIKRSPAVPWIGDMIVVKEYDQMDSLRDILAQPARKYGPPSSSDDGEREKAELATENELIPEDQQGLKRKRDAEENESNPDSPEDEPESKRRRFSDNTVNHPVADVTITEKSASSVAGAGGKENLPPETEV